MHLYRSKPVIDLSSVETDVEVALSENVRVVVPNQRVVFPKSCVEFSPNDDEVSEVPIHYTLVMQGQGFIDPASAENYICKNPNILEEPWSPGGVNSLSCNSILNGKDGFQLLSISGFGDGELKKDAFKYYKELKAIYDLEGVFTYNQNDASGWYSFGYNDLLEVISLPALTVCSEYFIGPQMPAIRVIELNKCTEIGNPAVANWFNRVQYGANYILNNALKTANAGAMHAGVAWAINSNGANVTWVD